MGIEVQCHFRALLMKRIFSKYTFKQCWLSAVGSISAKYRSVTLKTAVTHLLPPKSLEKQLLGPSCGGEAGPIEEKVGSGSTHAYCDVLNGELSPFELCVIKSFCSRWRSLVRPRWPFRTSWIKLEAGGDSTSFRWFSTASATS